MPARLIAKSILSTALALLPLSLAGAQPAPLRVTVRVTDPHGQGVRSRVHINQAGAVTRYDTASNGIAVIDLASCVGSMGFTVVPVVFYLSGATQQVDCGRTEVPFRLTQNRYAGAVLPAYVEVQTAARSSAQFASAPDRLSELLETGSAADIAVAANELAASLRRAGDSQLADAYSVIAIQAGLQAIDPNVRIEGMERYLAFDPAQSRYVTSPEGIEILARFQREANVPTTGQWDYRTFRALPGQ